MSNGKYDIQPFAQSLLSDVRRRTDEQTQSLRDDRDRLMRQEKDRQKKIFKYTVGANVLMGIGNSIVKKATDKFMQRSDVMDNNIKFKNAFNGASGRQAHRLAAMNHEKGEDDWYTNYAMKNLSPTFTQGLSTSLNESQRNKLIYEESYKAGQDLKKLYDKNKEKDLKLLEAAGSSGAAGYTDALRADRPSNIGSLAFNKMIGFFKDEDPLDSSARASLLLESSENVKAFGDLRKAGFEPYRAKEKINDLKILGLDMDLKINSQELKEIKFVNPDTDTTVTKTVREIKYANGQVDYLDLNNGKEINNNPTLENRIGKLLKYRKGEIEVFGSSIVNIGTEDDLNVIGGVAKIIQGDSNDQKVLENRVNYINTKLYITRKSLMDYHNMDGKTATQIAIKMHRLNYEGMIDEKFGDDTLNTHLDLIVGEDQYNPFLTSLAIEEYEKETGLNLRLSEASKNSIAETEQKFGGSYIDILGPSAQLRLKKMTETSGRFTTALSNLVGDTGQDTGKDDIFNDPTEQQRFEIDEALYKQQNPQTRDAQFSDNEINRYFNKVSNQEFKLTYPLLGKSDVQKLPIEEKRELFNLSKRGERYILKFRKADKTKEKIKGFFTSTELERELSKASRSLDATQFTKYNTLKTTDEKIEFLKSLGITINE